MGPQTFDDVTLVDGNFNVILGPEDENALPLSQAFSDENRFIEISQAGIAISPRQQVLSAPYALVSSQARNSDLFEGYSVEQILAENGFIGGPTKVSLDSNIDNINSETIVLETEISTPAVAGVYRLFVSYALTGDGGFGNHGLSFVEVFSGEDKLGVIAAREIWGNGGPQMASATELSSFELDAEETDTVRLVYSPASGGASLRAFSSINDEINVTWMSIQLLKK